MSDRVNFDPFERFRQATRARIGLGRVGDSLPTRALLEFQLSHARARDAVHGSVDFDAMARRLSPLPIWQARSRARDRAEYLTRPDLGRELDPDCVPEEFGGPFEIAFVIADGLSAAAVENHGEAVLAECLKRLGDFKIAPIILGNEARVAFGDHAAKAVQADLVVVLIGERPGLSVPDSLGAYVTWAPEKGRRDNERNCISNIHANGLSYEAAAARIVWIVREAFKRKLTGVGLKEDADNTSSLSKEEFSALR